MINHPRSWPRKTVLNDVIMSSKDSVRTQKLVGLSEINMIALVRGDQGGASGTIMRFRKVTNCLAQYDSQK